MPYQTTRRAAAPRLVRRAVLIQPLEGRRLMSVAVATTATVGPSVTDALIAQPQLTVTPAAVGGTVVGFTPGQIRTAYGFSSIANFGSAPANGAGQTIAIVDAYNNPNAAADLRTFSAQFGLATPQLTIVNQTGGASLPFNDGGWGQEIDLDLQWAHAIAPGAKLLLVETRSASITDLLAGVDYARHATGVSAVGMSWGVNEFAGETGYDTTLGTPSGHAGVTLVAAAGDTGTANGALWPAASGRVVSVGGTSLTVTSSNGYSSETAWTSSGGGTSRYEGRPAFQNGVQSSTYRTVPDVAYDSNPNTGFAVYDSYAYAGNSGWLKIGGTSAAVPQWAGLIAIANQGRAANRLAPLAGTTNALPALYALYKSAYASSFHDVRSGSSGSIAAKTGYDNVTGLGTPQAKAVVAALVKSTLYTPVSQVPVSSSAVVAGPVAAPAVTEASADLAPSPTSTDTTADRPTSAAQASIDVQPVAAVDGTASVTTVAPAAIGSAYVMAAPAAVSVAAPFAVADVPAVDASPSADVIVAAAAPVTGALSAFTLNLPTSTGPLAASSAAGSFAAMLASSTRSAGPLAAAVAAGAAVAYVATAPARDRRRSQVVAATPFGDEMIGVALLRA